MSVGSDLAAAALAITYDAIPAPALEHLKLHLADAIGCAVAAVDSPPVAGARQLSTESFGGRCTVVGTTTRAEPELATFVNSLAVRHLDYCDVYLGKEVTPPAATGPAALAMTEITSGSGREYLANLATIYETLLRLCDAASLRRQGWDTVVFGAVAAAVGAARALGLDQEGVEQAIAIAAVAGTGLLRARLGRLSTWKSAASANAAKHGVFAARLAFLGISGPTEIFEGADGVFDKLTGPFRLPPAGWRVEDVLVKRYPAQVFTQAAIEAAINLSRRVAWVDLSRITVATFQRAIESSAATEAWAPETSEAADHSLPFVVAVALVDGEVTPETFRSARYADADVRGLMSRVEVREDPELSQRFPGEMAVRVEVRTRTGSVDQEEVLLPLGHPKRPMDRTSLQDKFMSLCKPRLGDEQASELFELVLRVDEPEAGLSRLTSALRAASGTGAD